MKALMLIVGLAISSSAFAGTAFFKYERISGMNKLCFYDYLGSEYVRTIRSHQVCPTTIQV
jgi:hypothetical protein